jgi:hypothetical protein
LDGLPVSVDKKILPQDTRQAVNWVVRALVATGYFYQPVVSTIGLPCPDSGRRCKGLRLVSEE